MMINLYPVLLITRWIKLRALAGLPNWPAGMSVEVALAYTGVSQAQLRIWQRDGSVQFLPIGPKGKLIAPRWCLDEALQRMFATGKISTNLDFA